MEVFAVDTDGRVVTQPGVEGELWARGACVAQGYWGDEEKTNARFVINPHNPHFREFAFNTGDVVFLDEDGLNWRFIGRRDHMIKSRGYRIELGEIEAALYTHPAIKEAVVIAIPDPLVTNRLKAFVVLQDGAALNEPGVKAHCSKTVPAYMIPEAVAFLPELPKTSTGKIDRTLLLQGETLPENQTPG
jgi:acyl-coenzyme A synthetase/AMP-(fatty) acid ligase